MSAHDKVLFKPENGDQVGAILFKQSADTIVQKTKVDTPLLSDTNGDWIFSAILNSTINLSNTLSFRFFITYNDLQNSKEIFEELLPIRKVPLNHLIEDNPAFQYNLPYIKPEKGKITFAVNMNNQKVLGFFKPEEGDRVIISGNFCNWNETGFK